MDVQIIGLWVGLAITFLLGLINFLWGPAILARREKVAIVNPKVYVFFLSKATRQRTSENIVALQCECDALSIDASCELVLTQGEKELEVKEVELILDEKACKGLERYFHLSHRNRLNLEQTTDYEGEISVTPILLSTKKTARFKSEISFDCTDEFEREHDKIGVDSYPEFIQHLLDELATKYQICWTRYDGKRLCWHFPDKWWRNLGKKLWR